MQQKGKFYRPFEQADGSEKAEEDPTAKFLKFQSFTFKAAAPIES